MTEKWSPSSWRTKKAKHIPAYKNEPIVGRKKLKWEREDVRTR